MFSNEIEEYFYNIKKFNKKIKLGFHGHDNLGMSCANAFHAYKLGFDLIDVSMQGLGRSSGNTPLETFLCLLERNGIKKNIDKLKNLRSFFNKNKWLRFKYVFIDCGTEKVLENAVPLFWSRLLKNGVMILDHYNNPTSPSESYIIDSVIGSNSIEKFHFSDHPSAFIIKKK